MILIEKTSALIQVGIYDEDAKVPFSPSKIYNRELRMIVSSSSVDKFGEAVDVIQYINAQARQLVGNSFPVWDFGAAVDNVAVGHSIKTQLHF